MGLPFEAQTAHSAIDALNVLRDLYARKAYTLPDRVTIRLGRAWRDAIDGYDRYKALLAFERTTLFALRVALCNGSLYMAILPSPRKLKNSVKAAQTRLPGPDEWRNVSPKDGCQPSSSFSSAAARSMRAQYSGSA
ncbi:hypothetical protein OKW42_001459 [Paraburkholderia sp. WC7.3d]|uniref:Uncharacterized protein n=1 Tax=Paraburkholderia podalyriae TaxID=1938811 RepID=A0ABR7Q279_9BURK|nr:hypothetical protein [Paraburkholderia podalyriae]